MRVWILIALLAVLFIYLAYLEGRRTWNQLERMEESWLERERLRQLREGDAHAEQEAVRPLLRQPQAPGRRP